MAPTTTMATETAPNPEPDMAMAPMFTPADLEACSPYDPISDLNLDPSLLSSLSESDRREALSAAASARRAEDRAERRELERAAEERRKRRLMEEERVVENGTEGEEWKSRKLASMAILAAMAGPDGGGGKAGGGVRGGKPVFLSKKKREEVAKERNGEGTMSTSSLSSSSHGNGNGRGTVVARAGLVGGAVDILRASRNGGSSAAAARTLFGGGGDGGGAGGEERRIQHLTESQLASIKRSYLGKAAVDQESEEARRKEMERQRKARRNKKITFKFEWDASEDTAAEEVDPLYTANLLGGGGGGSRTSHGRRGRGRGGGGGGGSGAGPGRKGTSVAGRLLRDPLAREDRSVSAVASVGTKPLDQMTTRDWRIFRENYDITVRGGKAPPPLRTFRETPVGIPPIHPALLDAIENTLRYREPSPIQRQAIPIGLQRRDLIGIAETGSGKTAAFGIPLCHHILSLPRSALATVAEDGPLALVMAPTRELALQIDAEFGKLLSRQKEIATLAVVGGQPIQNQASRLRDGVHVVVGTPGRLNDCLEMAYLVLNQCSYVVLDEADRMIDLGFAPQIEQILEGMGGLLKSENETEAYRQEREDLEKLGRVVPRHRLTAMFSATMPSEVERIAKRYLRHPAVVSIGDEDSGKNARIEQRVVFLNSPSQKESALRDVLSRTRHSEKVIVFVNEKRHADGVGRLVESFGRRCVVLHGGKTQDQREENLEAFRRGGVVLVATDVAGRGLDIPDVSHVINYDLPSRSIDNYCHRIGRTGRAGKVGVATSFITDADEGIMAPLRAYLESTGSTVPDRLARHPASTAGGHGAHIR